jgi:hypothetical protein
MTLTLKDLDGKYRVTTVSDYQGPVPMKSDGVTEVKNGKTERKDAAGVRWSTSFEVLSDSEVKLTSTADPSNAKEDFLLTKESGELTHEEVTYATILKASRKGDEIRLSGTIKHGDVSTIITMTKIT